MNRTFTFKNASEDKGIESKRDIVLNEKYLSNKNDLSEIIENNKFTQQKFDKLSVGFKNRTENNIVKSEITTDNVTAQEVKYVFQHVKEDIKMREQLDMIKSMNKNGMNYESVIEDDRMKDLSNDIQNDINKLNKMINDPHALKPVEDPFGIKRGICQICLDGCSGYSPSHFYLNNMPSLCASCKCGATSHQPLEMDSFSYDCFNASIKNEIMPLLQIPTLSESDINFNSFLVLFSIDEVSHLDRNEISNFLLLLKEGGFDVVLYDIKNISLNENLVSSQEGEELDILKSNVNKYYGNNLFSSNNLLNSQVILQNDSINFNKYEISKMFFNDTTKLSLVKDTTFGKLNKISDINKNIVTHAKSYLNELIASKDFDNLDNNLMKSVESLKSNKTKFLSQLKNKIHSDYEVKAKYTEVFKKPVLALCLSNQYGISHFEKFYLSIKNNKQIKNSIIKNLHLAYYSNSKIKALWDLQATFPALFKIQKDISIVSEKPDLFSNHREDKDTNNLVNSYLFNSSLNFTGKKGNNSKNNSKLFLMEETNFNNLQQSTNLNKLNEKDNLKFDKYFSQFKDFLIANSINLTASIKYEKIANLLEELSNNSNAKSNFVKNLIKYISHSEGSPCGLAFSNKVGNLSNYNLSGFCDKIDIINFKSPIEFEMLSNIFFQNLTIYSKVMLIFRPIIVRNGLVDVILNIFKLNNFFILKRKVLVLNKIQVQVLYQSEFSGDQKVLDFEDYFNMMTDFNVEIVILSKFGAFEESRLLCGTGLEGLEGDIKNTQTNVNILNSVDSVLSYMELTVEYEVENDLIHKDDKIKKTKYQEKLTNLNSNNNKNSSFSDVTSLINVNKVISGIISDKNKNYINKDYQKIIDVRRNIIRFCSLFNVFMYNSKNIETVDQEIGFFFPEFGSIQEVFIMLKPKGEMSIFTYELIIENIKQTFERMNFEILDSVKYKLNEDEYGNSFDKYFSANFLTPYEYYTSKEIFTNNEIQILRLVKTGGMIDACKIIGKENFNFVKFAPNDKVNYKAESDYEKIQLIKQNSYILSLSSDIEYFYPIVNDAVSVIEGGYLIKRAEDINNSNLIIQILNSCIKCTVGEFLRFDPSNTTKEKLISRYLKFFHYDDENKINAYFLNVLDQYMFSKWSSLSQTNYEKFFEFLFFNKDAINTHIAFFVESNDLGFYEVRIPIMDKLIDTIDFNIARNYLYSDNHFYREIAVKYSSNKIVLERLPFSLSNDKENNDLEWMEDHLDINRTSVNKEEDFQELRMTFNIDKIKDNLQIIKKRLFYKTKFECSKMFNLMCSYLCDDNEKIVMAPKNYHYRMKPDDITMDIRRIYEVEEFSGLYFIEVVSQDYIKYRNPEWDETKSSDFRYSLPTYLWGRKLAKICERLEKQNPISDSIENSGPLIYSIKDEKLKGVINTRFLIEYDQYLYINILYDLKTAHDSKTDILFDIFNEQQYKAVEDKLLDILNSDTFIRSRSEDSVVLSPLRISETNLRISKRKNPEPETEAHIKNNKSVDMEHELKFHEYFKQNEEKRISNDIANKNVILTDLFCQKGSKYRSYAAFQYLLNVVYRKISRKSFLINSNDEEYDKMIEALLIGFNKNIQFDSPEINDGLYINAYKIEYFLYVLSEIKFMLNDLYVSNNKLKSVEENLKIIVSYQWQNKVKNIRSENQDSLVEYEKMRTLLKNNINELNMNIEILFFELLNYDYKHKILMKDNNKYYVLPKERYHIPMHFDEYWERNVNDERYQYKKVFDKTYLMDMDVVKALTMRSAEKELNASGSFRSSKNKLIITKSMLREPIKEISKEILIEKKKDDKKQHPIKHLAELIRKQLNI